MELEGLMELERFWVKGIWMRERALSVISWDCLFLTLVRRDPSPSHTAVISQADCYCSRLLTLPCPLYMTHLCPTLRKEAEVTLNRVTFCLNKYSELAGVRSEPSYLKADDKYV